MSDLRQMTDATALPVDPAGAPPNASQPAAATSEREGWLALVQLLEAAPAVDTTALVAGIERRVTQQRRRRVVRLAVAASLLLGVGWLAWQSRETPIAKHDDSAASRSARAGAGANHDGPTSVRETSADSSLTAWSDNWDDAVAQVAGDLYAVETAWREPPSLADAVLSDLDRLEAELQNNAL